MTSPTPQQSGQMPLDYALTRQRPWRLWLSLAFVVIVSAIFAIVGRAWITSHVTQLRTTVAAHYFQQKCVSASSKPGDVILRTDGVSTGIAGAVTQPTPVPGELSPVKPVWRNFAAFSRFLAAASPPPTASWAGRNTFFVRIRPGDSLVDCEARSLPDGTKALAWITASVSGAGIELKTEVSIPGSVVRLPTIANVGSGNSDRTWATFGFTPELGPVILRRVASPNPQEVCLELQHRDIITPIAIVWVANQYEVRVLRPNWDRRPQSQDFDLDLLVFPRKLPTVRSDLIATLPAEVSSPQAIAADADGIVIFSQWQRGAEFGGQVHRFSLADRHLHQLCAPDEMLACSTLSTEGSRIASLIRGDLPDNPNVPLSIHFRDLNRGAHFAFDDKLMMDRVSDDGVHIAICGIRTPIYLFDGAMHLVDTIPTARSDGISLNGRYLAWIEGGSQPRVSVYDLQTRTASMPVQLDYGEDQVRVSPDGRLAFCRGPMSCVIDTATGNVLASPTEMRLDATDAAFSRDGRWLVVTGHGAWLCDFRDRANPRTFKAVDSEGPMPDRAAFSPDSRKLYLLNGQILREVELDKL